MSPPTPVNPAFIPAVPIRAPRAGLSAACRTSPRMRQHSANSPFDPLFDRSAAVPRTPPPRKPVAPDLHAAAAARALATDAASPPGAPPRIGGNGRGNGRWHDDAAGDGGAPDHPAPSAELLAVLRAANRTLDSLPPDARAATADQARRLLAIDAMPLLGWLARVWPALRNRLVANERLPIQLGVELSVGFCTKTLAEVQGRGKKFWKEFDFYLSDLALELVGDAMLVWLLCPVAVFAGAAQTKGVAGFLQKLPKHAGQVGAFSPLQRSATLLFKSVQFGLVGFLSSMVGHGATTALVKQRRRLAAARGEAEEEGAELAAVVPTSLAWGAFMMASSNSRYQFVNGLEQRVLDPVLGHNAVLLTLVTFAVRFGNCFVGGVQWLPFARHLGIQ